MLVPEAELPVQAAAAAAPIDWMWYTVHLTVEEIVRITARVEAVTTALDAIRPALDMAVGLLGEDIYAAEILDDYMLAALVPAGAGQAPLPDATLDAAARTFATVSSGAPLLPGSILDVGNLISAAYDIVDQPPPDAPTPDGLLNDAITDLQAAFADGGLLTNVRNSTTAPRTSMFNRSTPIRRGRRGPGKRSRPTISRPTRWRCSTSSPGRPWTRWSLSAPTAWFRGRSATST